MVQEERDCILSSFLNHCVSTAIGFAASQLVMCKLLAQVFQHVRAVYISVHRIVLYTVKHCEDKEIPVNKGLNAFNPLFTVVSLSFTCFTTIRALRDQHKDWETKKMSFLCLFPSLPSYPGGPIFVGPQHVMRKEWPL